MRVAVFAILSLLGFLPQQSSACKCSPGSVGYDQDFCAANYAVEGTILDKRGNASLQEDIVYAVEVLRVVHDISNDLQPGDVIDIVTGSHSCGRPDLNQGWDYILAGESEGSQYHLGKCNGVALQLTFVLNEPVVIDTTCSASRPRVNKHSFLVVANTLIFTFMLLRT